MASERLSNLIKALHNLAANSTSPSENRTETAAHEIEDYLVKDPTTRKQMLAKLEQEIAAETGEFWVTVRGSRSSVGLASAHSAASSWKCSSRKPLGIASRCP